MSLRPHTLLSLSVVLFACDPRSESVGSQQSASGTGAGTGDTEPDGARGSSGTNASTTTAATTDVDASTSLSGGTLGDDDASTSTGNGAVATSTGESSPGFGCSPPPSCDRGELIGSVVVDDTTADLSQFAGYTRATGWVEISNSELECLDFLACLEDVGHDVTIFGNDALSDVGGLDALRRVGTETVDLPRAGPGVRCPCRDGAFFFAENDGIEVFDGLHVVTDMLTIRISENANLTTLAGLDALTTTGTVAISSNPSLVDVSQFLEGLDEARLCGVSGAQLCQSQAEALCASVDEDSVNVNGTDESC